MSRDMIAVPSFCVLPPYALPPLLTIIASFGSSSVAISCRRIDVLLCADVDITSSISNDIVVLQNAVMQQKESHTSLVLFQIVSPKSMSAAIAHRVLSTIGPSHVEMENAIESLSEPQFQERACFLFSLVPTLTVGGAIQCLKMSCATNTRQQNSDASGSGEALQHLLGRKDALVEPLASIQTGTSSLKCEVTTQAMQQLSYAATAPLCNRDRG